MDTKRIISLLSIVAIFVFLAYSLFHDPDKGTINEFKDNKISGPDNKIQLGDISLTSKIEGCASTNKQDTTESMTDKKEKSPSVEISGNSIVYSRAITNVCCKTVEVEKSISGNTINLVEVWGGEPCECLCFSKIEATLENLEAGTYTVNVYEKDTYQSSNVMIDEKLVITKHIEIR